MSDNQADIVPSSPLTTLASTSTTPTTPTPLSRPSPPPADSHIVYQFWNRPFTHRSNRRVPTMNPPPDAPISWSPPTRLLSPFKPKPTNYQPLTVCPTLLNDESATSTILKPLIYPIPQIHSHAFTVIDLVDTFTSPEMPKAAADKVDKKSASKAGAVDKKKKAKKDPNKPKRALSAYMFFVQDYRERVKAENPDVSFGEVGKLLGQKWTALSAAEKKPYEDQAAKDKTRAAKEKATFDAANGKKPKKSAAAVADDDDEDDE